MNINSIIRSHIQRLKPYSSARDEFHGVGEVFLDANESPYEADYNRYPDPHHRKLKALLSNKKNISAEQIFIGNGSDEAIDLLIRLTCEPGVDEVIVPCPTYGMYEVSANIHNVKVASVPLTPTFDLDLDQTVKTINPKTKIVFLCSPNNPTGNILSLNKIESLLLKFRGLIVVDEAYIDFTPDSSLIKHLTKHKNLVILQTFSKAYGMAGLRIGMAYTQPEIIEGLNKIKPPYNLSTFSQERAIMALKSSVKDENVETTIMERDKLKTKLLNISSVEAVFPSDANFLLVKVKNADEVYKNLITNKIVVRNRSKLPGCAGCLRITVGTSEENNTLIKVLSEL